MLACVRRNCPTGVLLRDAADAAGVLGTVDGGCVIAECEGAPRLLASDAFDSSV
jgi:hypothetical protein